MRLLHTSDWHLGRSLHREDLLAAQAAFVDWLVDLVRSEAVDGVLVSGDLYDRALPHVDAVALCHQALSRLADTGASVVVISGNHDSARRLGFAADLIARSGVHLRTDPAAAGVPVLVPGRRDGDSAAVFALPYLEPDAVRDVLGCTGRRHPDVLAAAMRRVSAAVAAAPPRPSVVMAHAFVAGGSTSDSERDLAVGAVGGAAAVPASLLASLGGGATADYVALGHLHGPQQVAPRVRYSGSPLAYSFSEAAHRKSVALVDLAPGAAPSVTLVPCPQPRPLRRLRGTLGWLLADASLADAEPAYVEAVLTDPARPREPMERLRSRFPHTLVVRFDPEGAAAESTVRYADRVRGRDDLAIATDFVAHVRGVPASGAEVAALREAVGVAARTRAAAEAEV